MQQQQNGTLRHMHTHTNELKYIEHTKIACAAIKCKIKTAHIMQIVDGNSFVIAVDRLAVGVPIEYIEREYRRCTYFTGAMLFADGFVCFGFVCWKGAFYLVNDVNVILKREENSTFQPSQVKLSQM